MSSQSPFQSFLQWLANLFNPPQPQPQPQPTPQPSPQPNPQPQPQPQPVGPPTSVQRKVLVLIFDPTIPSQGDKSLRVVMGWNDPGLLIQQYIADLSKTSAGLAVYSVVEQHVINGLPFKTDGFAYSGESLLQCLHNNSGFHQPDSVDYPRLLATYDIVAKVNSGAIDELWMFGPPYGGFFESTMAGRGAFYCNSGPLTGIPANRRFILMGFNYQRGSGEMLETHNHRAESILNQVFRSVSGNPNLWSRFQRYDKLFPGQSEVGTVHYAPNSNTDYEWNNPRIVMSRCDTWYHFPDLSGAGRMVNCAEWGSGDIRQHHLWWLRHIPHAGGSTDGVANNWWGYITDPNLVS